jgi:hypothetical protein
MPRCVCGVFFELKKTILLNDFGGIFGILDSDMVAI